MKTIRSNLLPALLTALGTLFGALAFAQEPAVTVAFYDDFGLAVEIGDALPSATEAVVTLADGTEYRLRVHVHGADLDSVEVLLGEDGASVSLVAALATLVSADEDDDSVAVDPDTGVVTFLDGVTGLGMSLTVNTPAGIVVNVHVPEDGGPAEVTVDRSAGPGADAPLPPDVPADGDDDPADEHRRDGGRP